MKETPEVAVYENGGWISTVRFKRRWHARLFHIILNKSVDHAGVRYY